LPVFGGCPRTSKRKLVRTIAFGGKTPIIRVCNLSGCIQENQFTQYEWELVGGLWACGKIMTSIGSGLALMPNMTDCSINFKILTSRCRACPDPLGRRRDLRFFATFSGCGGFWFVERVSANPRARPRSGPQLNLGR
jgi:hypothetical protein